MILKKLVDFYAHQSGVRDQLVAEREVVLTYALHAMHDAKALDLLAFKGGTCLRKIVFGSTGRFSEDLDFTLIGDDRDGALLTIHDVLNGQHHGVTFELGDDWYETDDGFGMEVQYRHAWNDAGKFRLQVSTREQPTLQVVPRAMLKQVYFSELEFEPFDIPCLATIEMASEKVRAAFQRAKVRDFYDLHLLTEQKLDGDMLRALVVLKLWQVRDAFDGALLFEKLKSAEYDWDDLKRLLRPNQHVAPEAVIQRVESHFKGLRDLTALEVDVVADANKGARNTPLGERLRDDIRRRVGRE